MEKHIEECFKYKPQDTELFKTKSFKKSVDHLSKLVGIYGKPFGQDGESPTTHDFIVIKTKVQAVNVQDLPDEYFVCFDEIADAIVETTKSFRNFSKTDLDRQQDEIKDEMTKYLNGSSQLQSDILIKINSLRTKVKDSKLNVATLEQKSVDKILVAIEKCKIELKGKLASFEQTKENGSILLKKYNQLVNLVESMTNEDIPVADKLEKIHQKFDLDVLAFEAKSAASVSDRLEMLERVALIVNALKDSFEDRMREDMEDALIELKIYESALCK
eukprot:NODE_17_length_48642_cov_1.199349.p23 type:complete len:274 gc:universal NODE_17_length_48642_cov_1.199349:46753-45932(-)